MGHVRGNQAMPSIAHGFVVLLLVLVAAGVSSVGSADVLPKRGLLDLADKPTAIAVDLMHVQHIDSPFRQPNITWAERVQMSVANSRRRLRKTSVFTSPLESTQDEYLMKIHVGTPARTFVTVADTGSDLVWLQCNTCSNCIRIPDAPFNPSASSSYINMNCTADPCKQVQGDCSPTNTCGYSYHYDDKSFTDGDMAFETFTFASSNGSTMPVLSVAFGCGTDDQSTSGLLKGADGLVGLGRGPLSLPSQLGSTIGSVFSYCLVDYFASNTETSTILLGSPGAAAKLYTPLITNPSFPYYCYVNLVGITVNGIQVNYPNGTFKIDSSGNGGIFLDSGTTFTYLFDAAYTPFENAISALIAYPEVQNGYTNLCYNTSSDSSPVFPKVVFQFENVDVPLAPSNTFLAFDKDTYCLAFFAAGTDAQQSIYGNIQQSNHEIAYDYGNNQVGFNARPITC